MLFDVLIRPAARVRCRTARIGLQYGAAGLVGKVCVVCICGWGDQSRCQFFTVTHDTRAGMLAVKTKNLLILKVTCDAEVQASGGPLDVNSIIYPIIMVI
jgi:hypothetical protein